MIWDTRIDYDVQAENDRRVEQRQAERICAVRTCRNSTDAPSIFHCSECQLVEFDFGKWNYCPNCGARIER